MTRLAIKRGLGLLFGQLTQSLPRKMTLLYHTLGERAPAVSVEKFRQQIEWLSRHAAITSLDDLVAGTRREPLQVAITFDDGYASLYDQVMPILKAYGATATVYLNTGWIGEHSRRTSDVTLGHYQNEQFMTWQEVETLAQAGWTIGSHGVEHIDLTLQSPERIYRELSESKLEIERRLNRLCKHFAYTWGHFTPQLQDAVRRAGYETAVSGLHGPVTEHSDSHALPRIDVRTDYEMGDFKCLVSGRWDYLGMRPRRPRKQA